MKATVKAYEIVEKSGFVVIKGYEEYPNCNVIAPPGTNVEPGDIVEYQKDGWNFGWFVKNLGKEAETK